jgi:hypothetical protein
MKAKLRKYKNKLKNKLKEIKIVSGIKSRDLVVVMAIVITSWVAGSFIGVSIFNFRNAYNRGEKKAVPNSIQRTELNSKNNSEAYVPLANTAGWKAYRSQKYGFEIKYPKEWAVPEEEYITNQESGYEYKISFKSFNVLIRDNSKYPAGQKCDNKEDNSPKYVLAFSQNNYAKLSDSPSENNSCAVKEIRILKNDFYFKKVFVYHIIKGKYSYDIVPMEENNSQAINYVSASAVNEASPELSEILSTFKFKDADPVVSKPRIDYVARVSCGEKNDHPSKSKTRGKHMDEDCCPDPDEWPKPGCIYSPAGRALMLSGPK